jgi:site-specific DNA-methyltransferase (adenine-specific)
MNSLAHGEVVEVLRAFEDNSFDALTCDPPYGLGFMNKKWDYDVPSVETWAECLRVLKPGAPLLAFGGSRTYHRMACGIEDAGFELRDCLMWLYGTGFPKSLNLQGDWDGYGTALKPGHEPIALARKPLDGTMSENVARWGVGGLAIDACRIGTGEDKTPAPRARGTSVPWFTTAGANLGGDDSKGRWPGNVLLDEEAAALLDAEVGHLKGGTAVRSRSSGNTCHTDTPRGPLPDLGYGDSGGPSRFFYCTKVNTKEREAGCEGLPLRSAGEITDREDGSDGLNSPRAGAGRTGGARNNHPTLKPIALTTWLAKLICPPNPGVILVPFAGAGSEMIGAVKAGWPMVFGIEREAEYIEIAHARLKHWCGN